MGRKDIRLSPGREAALRLMRQVHRFRRDERGSLMVFGLLLLTLMVMIGGLAVDLMRFESTRTSLQQAIDRCTLSAASLTQSLLPEDVVNDCMQKADKAEYLTSVNVDEGLNYREVTATATAATNPFFMQMMGIETLDAPAASKAEQKITNVEIAMVLDVSGSMVQNSSTKLASLKTAAKEFVDSLLAKDFNNRISIAIVPYNGQVNLPTNLLAKFDATYPNNTANMNCVDLPTSVYASSSMSQTTPLPMTANADTFDEAFSGARTGTTPPDSYVSPTNSAATVVAGNRWCLPEAGNVIRLPNNNITTLKNQINGLVGNGATSINAGMKWGLSLLDPAARPMFTQFVSSGVIPATFSGRPFNYDDEDAMKVIVVMTDGEHFAEERVNDTYKSGNSPIYKSDNDGGLSYKGTDNKYYWPSNDSTGNSKPYTNSKNNGTAKQLTWPEVWASYRTSYIAWQLYARRLDNGSSSTRKAQYTLAMDAFRTLTPTATMDTQLQNICTRAKNDKVVIFGIAFEAPANGKTQISNCSTSSSHYWDVHDLEIQTAFRAIASQISYLRLTQ